MARSAAGGWVGIAVVIAAGAGIAACLSPAEQRCADGQVCPPSYTCLPAGGCASPEQVTACGDLTDGATCSYAGVADGTCTNGACVAAACGNGVLDRGEACDDGAANSLAADAGCRPDCQPVRCGDGVVDALAGETCDDGNLEPGDGCRFDCRSDETCGNATPDYAVGESCDDGNPWQHDGCASTCEREAPAWALLPRPATVGCGPTVTVPGEGVMCVAAGNDGRVWTRRDGGWQVSDTPGAPPRRVDFATAYDTNRRQLVVFGGQSATGLLADLWRWDGVAWSNPTLATAPAPRSDAAMAYDPVHDQVVLYGGVAQIGDGITTVGDTWTWDGETWTERAPPTTPPLFSAPTLTFDVARQRLVLIGTTGASMEAWTWDGSTWTAVPAAGPPAQYRFATAYDPRRRQLVLVGGVFGADTWTLAGSTWTLAGSNPAGSPLIDLDVAYDPAAGAVVTRWSSFDWAWDGATWQQLSTFGLPFPQGAAGRVAAYDQQRGEVVVYDGEATWTSMPDSDGWRRRQLPTQPESRGAALAAYHPARSEVVLFGGYASATGAMVPGTWTWDGAAWTLHAAGPSPTPRLGHAMSGDDRGVVVLFGGTDNNTLLADTWEWDGTTWTDRTPATGPSARKHAAMTYDARRGRTVLFGGDATLAPGHELADTWTWDGTTWTEQASTATPPARSRAALAYDATLRQALLFGGRVAAGRLDDTWAWDGTTWRALETATRPPATSEPVLVYEAVRQRTLMAFGDADIYAFGAFWSLRMVNDALVEETCATVADADGDDLAGCADPDCWARCSPTCGPLATCVADAPRCGDGACATPLETRANCADDCDGVTCGDGTCGALETGLGCPADCGRCGDLRCERGESAGTCPEDCP